MSTRALHFIPSLQDRSSSLLKKGITQSGFGLIELMISLAIASFLVLGLMVLAGNMQRTYSTQTDMVGVSDKERFAAALFGNAIQTAGYYSVGLPVTFTLPNPVIGALPASTGTAPSVSYIAGQAISGTTGASSTTPDQLNVRFQSNAGDFYNSNCQGQTAGTASNVIFESVFYISGGNLYCNVYSTSGGAVTAGTPVMLIDGVSNMKILYGVDTTNTTKGSVTQYFTAASLPSTNWTSVHSVNVTLTFAATNNLSKTVGGVSMAAQTYSQTYQVMYAVP